MIEELYEPTRIQAGDTLTWRKTLTDYSPSEGWVLSYILINSSNKYTITASSLGSDFVVLALPIETSLYKPERYNLYGYVTKGSDRYSIYSGRAKVLPDLAAQVGGYDSRSSARKILDLLDETMLSQGANAWVESYEIDGRSMRFRSPGDFIAYRSKILQEVQREERAEKLRSGINPKNRIQVRF